MPIFRIFEFCAGIALCGLQRRLVERRGHAWLQRHAGLCLAVAVGLFALAIQEANHIPLLVMSDGFLLPVYALLILGLTNVRGWVAHVFSHQYPVVLGEASYALYLLHAPLWSYFVRVHAIDSIGVWLVYVGVVLAASVASLYLLERPARRAILRLAAIRPTVVLEQEELARG
jgi:peptidoglycan/LPS O-acetylase OafA/YrhL